MNERIVIIIECNMKKYDLMIFVFFVFFVCLFSFPIVFAHLPLSGKVIFLDAGHGGVDPGSVVGSIYEKDINLSITKFLGEELTKYGALVFYTRDGDYDLGSPNALYRKKSDFDGRIKKINESYADLYLSIHLNVLQDARYDGPQVFFNQKHDSNEELAKHIQTYLNQKLNHDREVKKIPFTTYMYSKLSVPGVLVECGFLSNFNERKKLITESYQREFAKYLAEAIQSFNF